VSDGHPPAGDPAAARQKSFSEAVGESFWLSAMWLCCVFFFALTADFWALPAVDEMDWHNPAAPPGTEHRVSVQGGDRMIEKRGVYLLGTDTMGRDVFARIIFGARVSLAIGLTTPCIGMLIGGILGMLAGFYRGRIETLIVALMDAILAFPGLVLLLAITFVLGPGLDHMIMALGVLTIPSFTRVARANTLKVAGWEFVQSARMLGQSDIDILLREILPNVIWPLVVYALLVVSYMIVAEGALSFLGLGVPPPTPSWGGMIAEGKEVLDTAPHVSLIPALAMFLTVLSFNIMGDCLRQVIEPEAVKW
jgi:peptide/nickel transport system permease protein